MTNQKKERNPSLRVALVFLFGMAEMAAGALAVDAFNNEDEWKMAASGAMMLWMLVAVSYQFEIIGQNFANKKRTILNQQRRIQHLEQKINKLQNQR